jgi:hypothetical protein
VVAVCFASARCEPAKSAAESHGTEESHSSNVRLVTAGILSKWIDDDLNCAFVT